MTELLQKKDRIQNGVKEVLEEDNLFVNDTKTEITKVERNTRKRKKGNEEGVEEWRDVVKLGSKLGDTEDVERRKNLATGKLK